MAKNLMPEVLKMLGVEEEEQFQLRSIDSEVCEDGLFYFDRCEGLVKLTDGDVIDSACDKVYDILVGYYEIIKMPWEPKYGDNYYFPNVTDVEVSYYPWHDHTFDYAMKALGMIYRTEEEAKTHFPEDYERLTGKKLEG